MPTLWANVIHSLCTWPFALLKPAGSDQRLTSSVPRSQQLTLGNASYAVLSNSEHVLSELQPSPVVTAFSVASTVAAMSSLTKPVGIVCDVNGTLFSLDVLSKRMQAQGLPAHCLQVTTQPLHITVG